MTCPAPRTTRTGEIECPACGRTWSPDESAPECSGPQAGKTSRSVAEKELTKIREILSRRAC